MADDQAGQVAATVTPGDLSAAFVERLAGGGSREPNEAERDFLFSVIEDYRADELAAVTVEDLAEVLAAFWTHGQATGESSPDARLIGARGAGGKDLGLDLLEIVQPDAPFLVDSVMGAIVDRGAEIRAMFHPVAALANGRRSMIQVWLSPVPDERRAGLIDQVLETAADVQTSVADFPAMLALLARATGELMRAAPGQPEALREDIDFLRWMDDGHFVFVGARVYNYPRTADGGYAAEEPDFDHAEGGLGVLRDPNCLVLRRINEPAVLSESLRYRIEAREPVIVAKANLHSRVHRRAPLDYVGVRRYGPDGRPVGEIRFVGLFTAHAYNEPARETPLLRRKVRQVIAAAGFPPGSHNAMRLSNILETYPRDELFQASVDDLLPMALGVLHLSDRPRIKLFVRRDPFNRFLSVLFYAPRDRYDARLRRRAGEILAEAFGGVVTSSAPTFSDAPLARVHYILQLDAGITSSPELAVVEAHIAQAARTWNDDLEAAIRAAMPQPGRAAKALATYGRAFPPGYCDRQDAEEGLADLLVIEALGERDRMRVRAFRGRKDSPRQFHFKLYHRGASPAPLARMLSILEQMGLDALAEEGFEVTPDGGEGPSTPVWIHSFLVDDDRGERLTFNDVRGPFERGFTAVWRGAAENDRFNRLILELGVEWREAALIRSLARYRAQSGLDPAQAVQEAAVATHAPLASLFLRLFETRFRPADDLTLAVRAERAADLAQQIEAGLMAVESLDHDRVLRRIAALIGAITRTNYYQLDESGEPKAHISFKIASRELADLPAPKPFREIFVASPVVEGVHLRFGPVARGGLRWSDRQGDFRTEVLGLVKAQQVKNAVIVPVGSKGGFYPKQLPRGGSPAATRDVAIEAYRIFLRGLLDITDNIDADGVVIHPGKVVVHDGEDPYLVVAADKGTATFSDIANGVAADYGFWLGDAFASGGSAGYDHKAMGITARGAWESVKRHFRELGKDIQREPFTVVGVGDMSGDVFGNGMLLSQAILLRAAFDHRHIFLDPRPDPLVSWAERKRLFDLPGSSWSDYDRNLISAGGGVWSRLAKSIALSEPVKALFDLKVDEISPSELIVAILKSRAELLYLGGIGTYVKAAAELQAEVGDKANDLIRVNGADLRCRVVAEGANLGLTQAGRIEFALAGGRINTDAIDNSAGVDTSDHEVNIKILAGMAIRSAALPAEDRNDLLASMTDDIARLVLRHNHDQTLQLSLQEADGLADLDVEIRFMAALERTGRLDRALEGLPSDAALADRAKTGKGLTRPERAVLMAYGKLELFDEIIASSAPDDPYFEATLRGYFPGALLRFEDQMKRHRLRREIIATVMDNDIVNLFGPTFAGRLKDGARCDTTGLVVAFEAARQTLRFNEDWARVSELDGEVPAAAQLALYGELARILRGQTYWFARRTLRGDVDVRGLIDRYQPAVDTLRDLVPAVLSPFERKAAVRRSAAWIKLGAPKTLAHSLGLMRPLTFAADLGDLAAASGWPLPATAYVYHRVGGQFGFDRMREAAAARSVVDPYERLAVRRLIEDLLAEQASLSAAVIDFAGAPHSPDDPSRNLHAVSAWIGAHQAAVRAARDTVTEIETSPGGWSFAKLTIANAALRELAGS